MAELPYQQYTERMVGEGHPTLSGTNERALRALLSQSGYDPDADPFPGLMGPVFNVKAFGAVGDGVTSDAAAINDTLGVGGRVVYVPSGDYLITTSLLVPSNTTVYLARGARLIRGFATSGTGGATLRNSDFSGGNSNISVIGDGELLTLGSFLGKQLALVNVDHFTVRDVRFGALPAGIAGMSFNIEDCSRGRVSNIYVNNGGTVAGCDGLHISGACSGIVIEGCDITSGDDPIGIVQEQDFGTGDVTDITITGCRLVGLQNGAMIRLHCRDDMTPSDRAIRRVTITGCSGRSGAQGLIFTDDTDTGLLSDIVFADSVYDGSGDTLFPVFDGVQRMTLSNVKIREHSRAPQISNCDNVTLLECEISGVRNTNNTEGYGIGIATGGPCSDIKIIGGRIADAVNGSASNGNGIQTSGTHALTDLVVEGLLVADCERHGILLNSATAGALLKGNRVRGSGLFGVNLNGCSTATVDGNDLRGNTSGALTNGGTNSTLRGNRWTTDPTLGRAVLVNGTVTVSTTEVRAGDNISLTRVVGTGTTRGVLSVGTIVAGTSFVINSTDLAGTLSADDDSTVFWEIVH